MQAVNVGVDEFGRTDQQDGEDARVLVIELVEVKHRIGHDRLSLHELRVW